MLMMMTDDNAQLEILGTSSLFTSDFPESRALVINEKRTTVPLQVKTVEACLRRRRGSRSSPHLAQICVRSSVQEKGT